jgi:hypothetical protein
MKNLKLISIVMFYCLFNACSNNSNETNTYINLKDINSVEEAKNWIDAKNEEYILEFTALCNQKDNDFKKEQAIKLYNVLDQFYFLQGDYDISQFTQLSYDEQKKVNRYSSKITGELPQCIRDFIETGKLCDDCWGLKNKGVMSFKTDVNSDAIKSIDETKDCLINNGWYWPSKSNAEASWKFDNNGSFNYQYSDNESSNNLEGNWKIINPGEIEISYTKNSNGSLPDDKEIELKNCNTLMIGKTAYSKN